MERRRGPPQDSSRATFTCKRLPADNEIHWSEPAEKIYNLIRATTRPYPGAFTHFEGKLLRIWSTQRPKSPPPV